MLVHPHKKATGCMWELLRDCWLHTEAREINEFAVMLTVSPAILVGTTMLNQIGA
jgi:hypothetical protein